jgi:hypothetical protein
LIFSNSITAAAAVYRAYEEAWNSDDLGNRNRHSRSRVDTAAVAHDKEREEEKEDLVPPPRFPQEDDNAEEKEDEDDFLEDAKGEEAPSEDLLATTADTEEPLATTGCPEAKLETEMENCPAARRRVSMTSAQDLLPVQATITQSSRDKGALYYGRSTLLCFLSIVLEFLPANARSIIVLLPSRPSRDKCALSPLQKNKNQIL